MEFFFFIQYFYVITVLTLNLTHSSNGSESCEVEIDSFSCLCGLSTNNDETIRKIECLKIDQNIIGFPNLSKLNIFDVSKIDLTLSSNEFSHVPSYSFNQLIIKRLDLSSNNIQILENHAFDNIFDLEDLILRHNKIEIIYLESESLKSLNMLDLHGNEIRKIENFMFKNQQSLAHLDLGDNWIDEIDSNVFYNLTNLKYLNLNLNFLSIIKESIFKYLVSLEKLDLSLNILEEINPEMFEGLHLLTDLNLEKNIIKLVEPNSFKNLLNIGKTFSLSGQRLEILESGIFNGLKKVKLLDLRNNRLEFIKENSFSGLDILYELDLSQNKLRKLEDFDSFAYLEHVKSLNLGFNNLIHMKSGVLSGFKLLDILVLESNNLIKLERDSFVDSLTYLDLNLNKLQLIRSFYFENLVNLESLLIKSNQISIIEPKSFDSLINLIELDLIDNCLIRVDKELFRNMAKLETLYLRNNELVDLENGVFDQLESLRVLDLHSNKLFYLKLEAFSKLKNLEFLTLSDNLIKEITDTRITTLKIIYLSNNDITSAEKFLQNIQDLRLFHIDNNLIEEIIVDDNFMSIEQLDLSNNKNLRPFKYKYSLSDENSYSKLTGLNAKNTTQEFVESIRFDIFPNIYSLDLSHNNLSWEFLKKVNMEKINRLVLSNINFNHSISMFENCSFLTYIDLSNNYPKYDSFFMKKSLELTEVFLMATNITDFEQQMLTFSHFPGLRALDLSLNRIQIIKSKYFSMNTQLTDLNLSYNQIISIEQQTFSSNKFNMLDLSFNLLREVNDIFVNYYNIVFEVFKVNNNLIEKYQVIFKENFLNNNLISELLLLNIDENSLCKSIYLRNNSIQVINNIFFNYKVRSLTVLDLSMNKIHTIKNGSFDYFSNLEDLNLASNYLSRLDDSLFVQLYSLKILNLSSNYLVYIHKDLFQSLKKLIELDISHNSIKFIESESFLGLTSLEILNIHSHSSELKLNNITLKGLISIKKMYFSDILLSNQENVNNILKNIIPREYQLLKSSNQQYFYSIYLTAHGFKLDENGCWITIYFFRFKLNLNLKSEEKLFKFLAECEIYFNKWQLL
jgi:insulin-like growth factor-binding protein complex acid labile subunit